MPLLLLIASPLTRSLAIGGTLMLGTGCSDLSYEDCDTWYDECLAACLETDVECRFVCTQEYDACWGDAEQAEIDRQQAADAAADAALACGEVLVCTLESLGDGDGDGDEGDDGEWPPPDDADDWGEDWGEQQDGDDEPPMSVASPDLPEG